MGIWMIKISVIYLFIGTALGMYISIVGEFELNVVHTHVLSLGWTTMTLAGIIYNFFPKMEQSVLCKIQFYLFNVGLPIMLIASAFRQTGTEGLIPIVSTGAIITSIAILIFTINIFASLEE